MNIYNYPSNSSIIADVSPFVHGNEDVSVTGGNGPWLRVWRDGHISLNGSKCHSACCIDAEQIDGFIAGLKMAKKILQEAD